MKTNKTNQSKGSGSYRTADSKAQIEWELKPGSNGPEFSACGEYGGGGGQNIDTIAKAYPKDAMVQRIAKVWEVYHLNGMNAGTPEQEREIARAWDAAVAEVRTRPDAAKYFYDSELTQPNPHHLPSVFGHGSHYDWCLAALKKAGLYEVPLPAGLTATGGFPDEVASGARGYRYGERWVYLPIPAEVISEIESWSAAPQPSEPLHEAKAKQFLAEHGLKLRVTLSDTKPAHWEPSGHHYRVTLSGAADVVTGKGSRRLAFDFWGSQADAASGKAPDEYSVIACIASDIHTPETFEDFCSEFGEEEGSRKALQTFRRADRFARRLREFFTEEETEALGEIR